MKRVHLVTCVWGGWHVDMLTQIVWPCILAQSNLPAFMRACDASYRICTTRKDQARMRALPLFRALSELVPITFIDTPTETPEPQFHMDRFVTAMQEARDDGAIFFNLWPDVVFPDQILGSTATAINAGSAGCLLPSFRVVSETCVPDVLERFAETPGAPIAIAPGELVRLGVRHMHPLSATGVAKAIHGRPDTGLMYRVPGEGFVSRTSCNWLFIDPARIGLTPDGAATTSEPDAGGMTHIVTDSDDMFFLSLAPLYKELETFRPRHANDEIDIARLTTLPHVRVSPFIEPLDRVCTRLHYGAMTTAAWQPVEDRSEKAFRRVRMLREFLLLQELLQQQGCRRIARLISLALFTAKLPDGWLIDEPLTIFAPNDHAVEQLPAGLFGRLIDRHHRGDLLRALQAHTVSELHALPNTGETSFQSAAGTRIVLHATAGGCSINRTGRLVSEFRLGRHRICIVDRALELGLPGRDEER